MTTKSLLKSFIKTDMNKQFDIHYLGSLRTESTHLKSGTKIMTDAPVDNNGKGEMFSPTDLVASSLVSCMLTIVGINFEKSGRDLGKVNCEVEKVMASNPRRIAEIIIEFEFENKDLTASDYQLIHHLADACPVAKSLHPDLKITTNLASFYTA